VATQRALALAPWSASKIQTALRCPRLFHYRYVEKVKEPEQMPETRIGKAVHKSLELALGGMLLPQAEQEGAADLANQDEVDRFRRICKNIPAYQERIERFRRTHKVGRQFVEYRLAMDLEGASAAFYAKTAFYRGVIDVAYAYDENSFALVDHKTGMRSPNANIVEQLDGYAVLASSYFRNVQKVLLGVHWVTNAEVDWSPPLSPEDVESRLRPKLLASIDAAALAVADGPRAQESSWCLRCSYRSICPQADLARFEPVTSDPDPGL
jgi:CRISPR/Cas system-associated exonuclease Cas4 (RecB family)